MDLIQNDVRHKVQAAGEDEPLEEDARRQVEDLRGLVVARPVQADLVADQRAQRTVQLRGDPRGQQLDRHPPRLRHDDVVRLAVVLAVHGEVLRNLRRLAAPGEAPDEHHPIGANHLEQLLLVVEDAQLRPAAPLADDEVLADVEQQLGGVALVRPEVVVDLLRLDVV